jgi:protein Mpv17
MAPAALLAFAKFYNSNFDKRPVRTLIITNGALNTVADVLVGRVSSQALYTSLYKV